MFVFSPLQNSCVETCPHSDDILEVGSLGNDCWVMEAELSQMGGLVPLQKRP